jgi:DNA polymerase-3 subunit delta'
VAFADFSGQQQVTALLQGSLERGRLAHACLFSGNQLDELEAMALALAKTLNCLNPRRAGPDGLAIDCCDRCLACRRIDGANHPDVTVVRPESKSRLITIDQTHRLIHTINMKPSEARYKVGVIVAADRMNPEAANAFLKTLEEPPGSAVLILLTTEPQRVLETIVSRCLRLTFVGEGRTFAPENLAWIATFSEVAAKETRGELMSRYRLLGRLANHLTRKRAEIEKDCRARSAIERHEDVEPELLERWEEELEAAVEAEYRRQRSDLVATLQWWARDVWLATFAPESGLLAFPQLAGFSKTVAGRLTAEEALENLGVLEQLQRGLGTNAQEALAIEVGLLRLNL